LEKTNTKLYPFQGNTTIELLGSITGTLRFDKKTVKTIFYVTESNNNENLLSYKTAQELELI